jgi:thioredoxin:protein disulfide reductase
MRLHVLWDSLNGISADQVQQLAASHMGFALLLCFGSGILTSLTPCVYPMIPITINIFGRLSRADKKNSSFNLRTFGLAGIYVAGMCLTYSIMGLIAGMTGSMFGKLLQSAYMLGFLTILFIVLSLSQLGIFKMALPSQLQTKVANLGHGNSLLGIFLMGVVSGLIISPCVGPVIAGILAFVFNSSNAFLGLLYFLSFSLGLGVLFLLIGGFSGLLGRLPRSGAWMIAINRVLACLMLIAAGYYGVLWFKKMGVISRTIPAPEMTQSSHNDGIRWLSSEDEALKLSSKTHLPIIIDFTAEWCEACHELEKAVFQNDGVRNKLAAFVPLRLDFTEDSPANQQKATKYGVISLPTIAFVKDGQILEQPRINGVVQPEQFNKVLDQVTGH